MKRQALFVALLLALAPAFATAEPIVLTGGYLVLDWTSNGKARFDLRGTGQSRFTGVWDWGLVEAARCTACMPGDVISPNALFTNSPQFQLTQARGTATVGGTFYPTPDFRYGFVEFGGQLAIIGPSAVIDPLPLRPEYVDVVLRRGYELPFTLSGMIAGYDNSIYVGPRQVFSTEVVGHGVTSIELLGHMNATGLTTWQFYRSTYSFEPGEPVPEPASLVLTGTALLGLASALRLRRKPSRP